MQPTPSRSELSSTDAILLTGTLASSNLMAKDDFKNLGFSEQKVLIKKREEEEKGKKGELRW